VFISELDTFDELSELTRRYNVRAAVIDALPEQRKAAEFVRRESDLRVGIAYYGRTDPGHELVQENGLQLHRINRTEALEEMFYTFQTGAAQLPQNARSLGARVKDGIGDYYRQMMALSRVLEQNSLGNWVSRYVDNGKPDHFAHAEVYCLLALKWGEPVAWVGLDDEEDTLLGGLLDKVF